MIAIEHRETSHPIEEPDGFYVLQTSPLRGHQYRAKDKWLNKLELGDLLILRAEPANPFDRYAVRVETEEGNHIGYLPRQSNHVVSRLLQQKAPISARIAWLCPDSDPPLSLWVLMEKPPAKPKQIMKKK